MGDICEDCTKQCADHQTKTLLQNQHGERITTLEGRVIENSNDNNNMEGRVHAFIYMIGISFFLMCTLSYLGYNKITAYKDVASAQTLKYTESLSDLTAMVKISSERAMDVKTSQIAMVKSVNGMATEQALLASELTHVKEEIEDMHDTHELLLTPTAGRPQ